MPSSCLAFPIAVALWFSAVVYPFLISWFRSRPCFKDIKIAKVLPWGIIFCRSRMSFVSVQFSRSVMSNSLQPHGLQHAMLPCPSPAPRVYSNSCPLSRWCHPTILSSHPLLLPPSLFPSIRVFSNESVLRIRWPKYWRFSFSISPANEYSGLISFRMDWLNLLAV